MKKVLPILASVIIIGLIANCQFKSEPKPEAKQVDPAAYTMKGKELATATQKVLGGNLKAAIESKGTEHALEFCNVKAYPLTDSMAVALNAAISRVSDQPRNAANTANEDELAYIAHAKEVLAEGGEVTPKLAQLGDKVVGYYPIITNQLCMQCHGNPDSQIKDATLAKINQLYPADEATGYSEGELRGIWVVEMDIDGE